MFGLLIMGAVCLLPLAILALPRRKVSEVVSICPQCEQGPSMPNAHICIECYREIIGM